MEIQGSIKLIGDVQEISSTFKKRELVVTTEEQYPQTISVEFVQDKTDLLNSFKVGPHWSSYVHRKVQKNETIAGDER